MKNFVKKITVAIVLIVVTFIGLFFLQGHFAAKGLTEYVFSYDTENLLAYEVVRCNTSFRKPEFAFIDQEYNQYTKTDDFSIDFHYIEDTLHINQNDWTKYYIGSTDIINTTFPQLVAMVKEDCSQFQQGYDNPDPEGIGWTYTPAEPLEKQAKDIWLYSYRDVRTSDIFKEIYGDMSTMTDEELVALKRRITAEGMDSRVEDENNADLLKEEWEELTEEERQILIDTYGDWRELDDTALAEWIRRLQDDVAAGKFSLE